MPTQRLSWPPRPRLTGAWISRPGADFVLSVAMVGCTPHGAEIDDSLASVPHQTDQSEPVEAIDGQLEGIYTRPPDDDRTQPVVQPFANLVGESQRIGELGLIGTGNGCGYGHGTPEGLGAALGGREVRAPRVRQARPEVTGSLDEDIIRRIVRAHINEVRSCYDAGLARDKTLSGRVTIEFPITSEGEVRGAIVNRNDTGDEAVGACIAKAAETWQFPEVPDGGEMKVLYPFNLSPG
ncbi:AgmX/PglI C-terminal domain-containing protein [Enhygromyxa salina]|uniref:Gram-negative bacterial tonB protein n=1 Tax=Enhygromyxa salina TaxID=215803 RepID=A0A2S9YIE3_9BACT|nr:AgmX/PglI C-terminal domain-containing protein [Enhygromyxa salina]PRQ04822.1 hypothetical protein ENSA7_49950 [Enhygromyxa salina]